MRPAELHSPSAEENCLTENVASLRSVKVATPPCAAKAAIPCGLAVRKQHKMLFAASKFEKLNTEKLILSILVDTFSSRILNPMLLPSGKRNIVVF